MLPEMMEDCTRIDMNSYKYYKWVNIPVLTFQILTIQFQIWLSNVHFECEPVNSKWKILLASPDLICDCYAPNIISHKLTNVFVSVMTYCHVKKKFKSIKYLVNYTGNINKIIRKALLDRTEWSSNSQPNSA